MVKSNIGNLLKSKRIMLGLTANAVALKLGISEATLLHLESGKSRNYSYRTISRLILFYNLNFDEAEQIRLLVDPNFVVIREK